MASWEDLAKQMGPGDTSAPAPKTEDTEDKLKLWEQGSQPASASTSDGIVEQARSFTREHPYITAAAGMLPGVGPAIQGATGTGPDVGKGALKGIGRSAYGLLEAGGPVGMLAHAIAEKTGLGNKIRSATEPSNPAQTVGNYAEMGAEAALPLPKVAGMLPNAERAGQNFERVMQRVGSNPVDLTEAGQHVGRALELGTRGSTLPKVINDLAARIPQHTDIPISYREARDFASNAGRLSAQEKLASNPEMQRQVSILAKALDSANEAVAEKGGVGDLYRSAMKEYGQAKGLENAMKIAKKAVIAGATGAGLYGAGRHIARSVLGE